MLPMLVVKKKMNTRKQHGKKHNVNQRSLNISKFFTTSSLKNAIKNHLHVELYHDPIRV
jgi:hypothetical protein